MYIHNNMQLFSSLLFSGRKAHSTPLPSFFVIFFVPFLVHSFLMPNKKKTKMVKVLLRFYFMKTVISQGHLIILHYHHHTDKAIKLTINAKKT